MTTERRARGEGRVFLRGKVFWVQYSVRGRQVRLSADTDNEQKALKFLRKQLGEVEAGTHCDARKITYANLRASFYADYVTQDRKSLRRNKDGNPHLDKIARLDEFFGDFMALDIDADMIRGFIADQQGKGLANGTINRSISGLRKMFNLAKKEGKLRLVPYFPMVKEAKPRQGFFEYLQYEQLSHALPDFLRLPLAIGYFSGMRLGEILSLEWDQADFLAETITLYPGTTKNDEARTIPIVPQLRTLLIEQRAKRQAECPFVCFRLDRKGHAARIGSFRKVWQSRCVALGLGRMEPAKDRATGEPLYSARHSRPRSKPKMKMVYRGMLFHDLRRSGVRNLVRAGVAEKIAMQISGHKTRSVFDRYNIVSPNDVREAGRKLAIFHEQKLRDNSGTVEPEIMPTSVLPN